MALIETPHGDAVVSVSSALTQRMMRTGEAGVSLPVRDPLVQTGALNIWQPLTLVTSDIRTPMVITDIATQAGVVSLRLADPTILLDRSDQRPSWSVDEETAGAHVRHLVQSASDDIHLYPPTHHEEDEDLMRPYMEGRYDDPTQGATIRLRATPQRITVFGFGINLDDADTISQVRFRLRHQIPWNSFLAERMEPYIEITLDGGETFLVRHDIPTDLEFPRTDRLYPRDDWIDVTNDTVWTPGLLNSPDLGIRLSLEYPVNNITNFWRHLAMALELSVNPGMVPDLPIVVGSIAETGDAITLSGNQQSMLAWLQEISDQSGQEWRLRDTGQIGIGQLDWGAPLGEEIAPIEEGSLTLSGDPQSDIAGSEMFSRVRVQADGLPDYVLTDRDAIAQIGRHTLTIDLGSDQTRDDQAHTAAETLARIGMPDLAFDLDIARTTGIWADCELGNTFHTRIVHAPYAPWSGDVRIVGRTVDDDGGVMTLHVVAVRQDVVIDDEDEDEEPLGTGRRIEHETGQVTRDLREFWPERAGELWKRTQRRRRG